MRTDEEILDRVRAIKAEARPFDFRTSTLMEVVPFEALADVGVELKEGTTKEEWDEARLTTDDEVKKAAVDYLQFSFGKAKGHRGLSAGRAVDRMGEYLWLLGLPTDEYESVDYAMYGVPKLKIAADLLEVPFPESPQLVNMAEGRQCQAGLPGERCEDGCLQ